MKSKIFLDIEGLGKLEGTWTPVDQIKPPVEPPVEPPVITPPPINPNPQFIELEEIDSNINIAWQKAIQQKGKYIKLRDNKTYEIDEYTTEEPLALGVIGNLDESKTPNFVMGSWTKPAPKTLFFFKRPHAEFSFVGANLLQPKGTPKNTRLKERYLFDGQLDVMKTARLSVIGSRCYDKDQMGWAITEMIYSSGMGEKGFIDIIVKDFIYNGSNFTQLKCPRGNNIREFLLEGEIHNPIVEPPRTHYYNPTSFVIDVIKQGNLLIAKNGDFNLIKTHHGFEDVGVRSIVQLSDAFVFDIMDENVSIDGNNLILNTTPENASAPCVRFDNVDKSRKNRTIATNIELHPGDVTNFGVVIEKQIQNSAIPGVNKWQRWAYVFNKEFTTEPTEVVLLQSSYKLKDGPMKAMIAYKYNQGFSHPHLTINTKFNDFVIRQSGGIAWTKYDHREVNRFWRNMKFTGFMRDSTARQDFDTRGYNWENVKFLDGQGEITKREPFSDKVKLPEAIQVHIDKLEALAR